MELVPASGVLAVLMQAAIVALRALGSGGVQRQHALPLRAACARIRAQHVALVALLLLVNDETLDLRERDEDILARLLAQQRAAVDQDLLPAARLLGVGCAVAGA